MTSATKPTNNREADRKQSRPRNLTVLDIRKMEDTESKSLISGLTDKPFNNPLISGTNRRNQNGEHYLHLLRKQPGKSLKLPELKN